MKDELIKLKKELESIQKKCKHDWNEPIETVIKKEIIKDHTTHTGKYEEIPCWSRECKICGKKEYTLELKKVSKKVRKPNFKH